VSRFKPGTDPFNQAQPRRTEGVEQTSGCFVENIEHRTPNIEHRTSNIEHRSVGALRAPFRIRCSVFDVRYSKLTRQPRHSMCQQF
jgi:hypothetical protein